MSIFLNVDNLAIKGQASDKNHSQWIEINRYLFKTNRHSPMVVGRGNNCVVGRPNFHELNLVKFSDKSSVYLLQAFLTQKYYPSVVMDVCHTGDGLNTNLQYTFEDAAFNSYEEIGLGDQHNIELLKLSFNKMERRFTSYDKTGKQETPVGVGYDLSQAKTC